MRRAPRQRLDQLLVERGLAETRSRAQSLVLAGHVLVGADGGARRDHKPGDQLSADVQLALVEPPPYVSRGGLKLAPALETFGIRLDGLVCLDVGASTGGFTDVLLQRGARRVYALDVGKGQLAASLQMNPRVVVLDGLNARTLKAGSLPEPIDLATIDVSFISLRLVLEPVRSSLAAGGQIVALVKPQFEAGRSSAPGGVVRDPAVHRAVLEGLIAFASDAGLGVADLCRSTLTGPAGNREFFLHLVTSRASQPPVDLAARLAWAIDE